MKFVVNRSVKRMWLLVVAGAPLVVISLDILTDRTITNALRELLFRPEDTQIFEPRDVIWAWVMLAFGLLLAGWGFKEVLVPTKVIEGRDEGLVVKLNGPLQPPSVLPWDQIEDVYPTEADDEGKTVPVLAIRVTNRNGLTDYPWGARWTAERQLEVLAEDWDVTTDLVAKSISIHALDAASKRSITPAAPIRLRSGGQEEE